MIGLIISFSKIRTQYFWRKIFCYVYIIFNNLILVPKYPYESLTTNRIWTSLRSLMISFSTFQLVSAINYLNCRSFSPLLNTWKLRMKMSNRNTLLFCFYHVVFLIHWRVDLLGKSSHQNIFSFFLCLFWNLTDVL